MKTQVADDPRLGPAAEKAEGLVLIGGKNAYAVRKTINGLRRKVMQNIRVEAVRHEDRAIIGVA